MGFKVDNDGTKRIGDPVNKVAKPQPLPKTHLPKAEIGSAETKKNEAQIYAARQRERLERLLGAAIGGKSSYTDFYKNQAFRQANFVYGKTISDPANGFTDASRRALTDYRNTLNHFGVSPLESQNTNLLGSIDFLNAESSRSGGLTTLSADALQNPAQNGEMPKVYARMLWAGGGSLDKSDARLSFFNSSNNSGKSIAWATRVEDLAGSRLDYQEVMRRIGWTADDIANAKPGDFKLAIFTDDAAVNPRVPTADTIIDIARNDNAVFGKFAGKPDAFWSDVIGYDYQTRSVQATAGGFDRTNIGDFIKTLPPNEAEIFDARFQLENRMGVNPLFTGDGTTKRPDALNKTVGVREYVVNNAVDDATLRQMAKNGQVALIDMQDIGSLDAYKNALADVRKTNPNATIPLPDVPVGTTDMTATLPAFSESAALRSEMRSGALLGGTMSAVTSLPEIFDQAGRGDYSGAAKTLAVNTTIGTSVGGLSAGAERIAGQRIESALANSRLAQNGINRLYSNTAARSVVSRFAQTEASNLSSSAFNSTVRQIGSRVGGAGVIGGVVNGGFAAYDQIGAYNRGEVTASQAIGTVTGEAAVGVGAGMAGAAAGAAIGSIIPGAGTIVGGVIGFGVGMAAGYLADKGLRGLGVNTLIAKGVTATIDTVSDAAGKVSDAAHNAVNTISDAADNLADGAKNMLGGAVHSLGSIFG